MGFLSRDNVLSFEREKYQRDMEIWAKEYPLAAYMIFTKDSKEEKEKWVESYMRNKKS